MPFDPTQAFEVIEEEKIGFDESKPFEVLETEAVATAPNDAPDEFGIGQEVRGVGRAIVRGGHQLAQAAGMLSLNARTTAATAAEKKLQVAELNGDVQEIQRLKDFIEFNDRRISDDLHGIGARGKSIEGLPPSPDMANLKSDFWGTLARNPIEVIATVSAESLPQALPGMVAGGIMGGPVGMAAGVGIGSFAVEYANSLLESAGSNDPEAIKAMFQDPQKVAAFREKALARGIPVAFFDAVSGGIAGRVVNRILKAGGGAGRIIGATARELGEQAALGATGEAAGQLVSEGEITSVPDIVLEGLAEFGTSPGEFIGNLRESKAAAKNAVGTQAQTDAAFAKPIDKVPSNPADVVKTARDGGFIVEYTTKSGQKASLTVPQGTSIEDAKRMIQRVGGQDVRTVVSPGEQGTPAPASVAAANATAVSEPVEPKKEEALKTSEEVAEPISPTESIATEGTPMSPKSVSETSQGADAGVVAPAPVPVVATEEPNEEPNEKESKPVTAPTVGEEPSVGVSQVGNDEADVQHNPNPTEEIQPSSSQLEAYDRLAEWVYHKIKLDTPFSIQELYDKAGEAFGSPMTEGKWTAKDATDAMELGVNRYVGNRDLTVEQLNELINKLPTQTRRTEEQNEFQQFSTPPPLALAANEVADIRPTDVVLEPSAGLGGLATFAKRRGAKVIVNELSPRRRALLEREGYASTFGENAEQLHNVLPNDVKPTVVVMNPPFSATAGRIPGQRKTAIGAQHVEQALKRLEPGGRLVAIVGEGMAMDAPTFKAWWNKIGKEYNVRANVWVSGKGYRKYGTTFSNRMLVIDKDGPTTGKPVLGDVETVPELLKLLAGVKRKAQNEPVSSGEGQPVATEPAQPEPPRRDQPPTGEPPVTQPGVSGVPSPDAVGTGREPSTPGRGQTGSAPVVREPNVPVGLPPVGEPVAGQPGPAAIPGGEVSSPSSAAIVGISEQPTEPVATGLSDVERAAKEQSQDTEAVFESYQPSVVVPGSLPHPTALAESAAMASVSTPPTTYTPNLPKEVVTQGKLSGPQLETVVLAGNAHQEILPNGDRRGFFIGDGTGIGKGREIAGIILDNQRRGQKKAVWISEKAALANDARRDMEGIGADPKTLIEMAKYKGKLNQPSGVLFTTYDTLKSAPKDKNLPSRLQEVVNWLGPDFDGVIAFDESHSMANAITDMSGGRGRIQPSARALAGIELQKLLPKARVVYVSATGATEVKNLAYASRLGLWGEGTPFADVREFISQISSGGVAAMEQVAKDMKALGSYIARQLDFKGVQYKKLEHKLTENQTEVYNTLAEAWQLVLRNIGAALAITGGDKNAFAKRNAKGQFWGAHQRFFNQVITSMQMPTIIADAKAEIAEGNAVIFQLVNTNAASLERGIAEREAEGSDDLEDMDLTPREQLIGYIRASFPTTQYVETVDDNGNVISVPARDSEGNFIENKDAVAMRDQLIELVATVRVPDGPIDIILRDIGVDKVAEVTGRKRRIVQGTKKDGTTGAVIEKRNKESGTSEANEFMADNRIGLVFSNAGGTGRSYHADKGAKNQRVRVHYVVQPGWVADKAVQGFGRSHRANQKQPPKFVLPSTTLEAQKRFISSIARRLDQLGALTKGERKAGGQGMFTMRDNLESQYAQDALVVFFRDATSGRIEGVDTALLEEQMGLNLRSPDGSIKRELPGITTFLNRLLSLRTDTMGVVFRAFEERMDNLLRAAEQAGTLDQGLETLTALSSRIAKETTVYTEPKTRSETKHVEVELTQKNPRKSWDLVSKREPRGFYRNNSSGRIWAHTGTATRTHENGSVTTEMSLDGVTGHQYMEAIPTEGWTKLGKDEAKSEWERQYDATPNTRKETKHIITGVILPIWDRIPGNPRIVRVITPGGSTIGRLISQKDIPAVLKSLGVTSTAPKLTMPEYHRAVYDGGARLTLSNGWEIKRSRVAGDDRIELLFGGHALSYSQSKLLKTQGVFSEQHNFRYRYFIPTGTDGVGVMERVLVGKEVTDIEYQGESPMQSLGSMPAQATGMEPGDVEAAANNMARNWGAGPLVVIANDPTWTKNGRIVEAEYDPQTRSITLNAAAFVDRAHVQQVMAEEALAHYGLEQVFGEELGQVLDDIPIPDADVFEVARKYGLDVSDPEQRRIAKAEWLGKRAQTEQAKGWLKRLLTAIGDAWNRFTGVRPAEQQARELLSASSKFLQSGEAKQTYFKEPLQSLGDQIDQIEAAAEQVNVRVPMTPKPVTYKPISHFERAMAKLRRPSEVIRRYDTTGKLGDLRGVIDVQEAWSSSALRQQAEQLRDSLFSDAKDSMTSRWPAWLGGPSWRRRARRYADLALPLAAHLNTVGRKPDGTWQFADLEVRAGTIPEKVFTTGGHTIGDRIVVTNPLTGQLEELTIGNQILLPNNKPAYQLIREVSEKRQEELYDHYNGLYPELSWFLDMWIDPSLASARMNVGGVDIPVFNRFSLAEEMRKNDPAFNPVSGYTPDVMVNRSLMGAIIGAMQGVTRGSRSPGRRYKTGRTRESGNVRDLLSGFNVRAFQAQRELSQRRWSQAALNSAVPVPATGIPDGWVDMGVGVSQVLEAIRRVNGMDPSAPYPELLKRLANDGSPEYKALLVEAHRLKNKSRMIPQPLLDSILSQYVQQEESGRLAKMFQWLIRNAKGLLLVHPKTILGNIITNQFFAAEAANRYAISGLLKRDGFELRFARNIMTGLMLNRFAGLRLWANNVFGRPNDQGFLRAVQTILPPEAFAGGTGLSDLQANYGDSAAQALREGEIATAALDAVQYGSIDLREKQRMAYAWLKAAAVTKAKAKGLSGSALKADVDAYMAAPPVEDTARAIRAANFELLNYADSPAFIAAMSRSALGSLVMPFPRFGYHFLTKQAQRLSAVRKILGNVPPSERADAFADLVVVGFYGLGLAGAALATAGGDDDDAREFAGTKSIRYIDDEGKERVEPIDPALNTFNRMNLSYWARASGLGGDGEEDFWVRVRTYPVVAAAGIGAIAMDDARQLGPMAGAKSYLSGITDLLGDFLSLGVVAKLPGKAWASMMEEATGRPQSVPMDNFSTGIPFMAWIGQQVGSALVPGQRQADELIMWMDPTMRRLRSSKTLDYTPGFWDGIRVSGTVGLLDRIARGGESDLPASGIIDRSTGEIEEPRQVDPMTRLWSLGGINAKMVPWEAYERALKD